MDAVLIARRKVAGRRHFDLAHELFHILTWDTMPPAHSEAAREYGGTRGEQLANSFVAAALMEAPRLLLRTGPGQSSLWRSARSFASRSGRWNGFSTMSYAAWKVVTSSVMS